MADLPKAPAAHDTATQTFVRSAAEVAASLKRESVHKETSLKTSLLAAMAGDAIAYQKFLGDASILLRGYLMRSFPSRSNSIQRVEDLVQEILLAIHLKKHTYRREMPLLPWMYAIAKYRMIDWIRAESRKGIWTELEKAESETQLQSLDTEINILNSIDVEKLLEGLTDHQRSVMLLAKVESLPLKEVAEQLGMSLSAVKVTVHRSIKAIKANKILQDDESKSNLEKASCQVVLERKQGEIV